MKKILSIGSDKGVFREGSAVQKRILKQGQYLQELHVIVFTCVFGHKELHKIQIGKNIWLYPTRSLSKILYIYDAIKLGKKILKDINLSNDSDDSVIITSQDPFESGFVGMKLKIFYNLPLQIQVHTDFLSPYFSHTLLNRIRTRIALRTLLRANRIRVVSKRIKKGLVELLKINPDKITVLPVFVDIGLLCKENPLGVNLRKKYPQFDFIILMASRLTSEKNISLGIMAFAKVQKNFPKAGMVIVGSGRELSKLKKLVSVLGLAQSVIFENWQNDLASYYKTADLFLLTSLYEGFGMTLIESAVVGCPIITTEVGIVGDLFLDKEHLLVCPVQDKDCFAEQIISIISYNKNMEIMKGNAKSKVLRMFDLDIDGYTKEYINEIMKTTY